MTSVLGTISIVSHGHGQMVTALLQDLAHQHGIGDWLVVLTHNIAEPFAPVAGLRVELVENESPLGFGANQNKAFAQAQGGIFLIVNPDIRLQDRATLQRLASLDWNQPYLRAPVIISPHGVVEDSVRENLSPINLFKRIRGHRTPTRLTPDGPFVWFAGMFLAVSASFFAHLRGFDERFFLYCEDYDLCLRWRQQGGKLEFLETLTIVHDARRDSHRSLRHMRWHLTSLARVWTSKVFWVESLRTVRHLRSPPALP